MAKDERRNKREAQQIREVQPRHAAKHQNLVTLVPKLCTHRPSHYESWSCPKLLL